MTDGRRDESDGAEDARRCADSARAGLVSTERRRARTAARLGAPEAAAATTTTPRRKAAHAALARSTPAEKRDRVPSASKKAVSRAVVLVEVPYAVVLNRRRTATVMPARGRRRRTVGQFWRYQPAVSRTPSDRVVPSTAWAIVPERRKGARRMRQKNEKWLYERRQASLKELRTGGGEASAEELSLVVGREEDETHAAPA